MAENHNVHSSYSLPHASMMGLRSTEVTVDMINIFYFSLYSIYVPKLVFLLVPKNPLDGIISNVIMFSTIYSFFLTIRHEHVSGSIVE